MNNFFSLRRFVLLFVKHTAEHIRTYLMALSVLAGVLLLGGSFIFFIIPGPPDTGLQTACFVILMQLSGTLFASTVFSDYGEKSKAMPAITLPASSFEKFLVGWLYSYPLFLIVYTGMFFLTLSVMSHLDHWPGASFPLMDLAQPEMYVVFVIFSVFHAISLFGAIFFEKLHFIKTGFTFFISYAILLIMNTVFLKCVTGVNVVKAAMPFSFLNVVENGKFYSIMGDDFSSSVVLFAMLIMTVLIWVAAYFRLKEKQV